MQLILKEREFPKDVNTRRELLGAILDAAYHRPLGPMAVESVPPVDPATPVVLISQWL